MVFFGQWNIPFGVPKSSPLTVVVGTPIEVPTPTPGNWAAKGSDSSVRVHASEMIQVQSKPVGVSDEKVEVTGNGTGEGTGTVIMTTASTDTDSGTWTDTGLRHRGSESNMVTETDSKISKSTTSTTTSCTTSSTTLSHDQDASLPQPLPLYNPSDEEVENYLETFIITLEKLYIENREAYGMGHVRLVVL